MDSRQLQERLTELDPGAVLVPGWMLRRTVKALHPETRLELRVPHAEILATSATALAQADALDDLTRVVGARALPERLVLIARPDAALARDSAGGRDAALLYVWRQLFHGHVDAALEQAPALPPAELRRRIDAIGQTAFDEVRAVLREEGRLVPPRDDAHVLRELTALWLELRLFAPAQLAATLPSLAAPAHVARVSALLEADLDAAALFARTRPSGAPDPITPAPAAPPLAPPPTTRPGPGAFRLAERLSAALDEADPRPWADALAPLTVAPDHAAQRVLVHLERVAADHERPVEALDPWAWLLSFGRKPLRRGLPAQRELRLARQLRGATSRAQRLAASRPELAPLATRLAHATERAEALTRQRLCPAITAALDEVGLRPRDVPEEVARAKLVAELVDRALARGFFTMGDLRDGLARGHLKLPDIEQAEQLVGADALIAADRALARALDGVYHRGEVYLRGLQRASSLGFGTAVGRWLVRFVALPFGGAALALSGLDHMVGPVVGFLGGTPPALATPLAILLVGLVALGAIHVPSFRDALVRGARATWRGLRAVAWDLPRRVFLWPAVQRVLRSPPARFAWRYAAKPCLWAALVTAPLSLAELDGVTRLVVAASTWAAATLLFNTPLGRAAELAAVDGLTRLWLGLRHRLLPGLVRLILDGFKALSESVERGLHAVEAWLRLARGERRAVLVAKAVLAALWAVVAWLARLYVNLLIEPQVNPIKHFPVVTVAHKLMLPFTPQLTALFAAPLEPLGAVIANTIAGATVFLLPGVFGFLAWELMANWRLYEGNRPRALRPTPMGSHGETLARLLRPGVHSGTVPKLFARLRRAQQQGHAKRVAQVQAQLHHVEDATRAFVARELVAVLAASGRWSGALPAAGAVHLASNRLCVALDAPDVGPRPVILAFEEQSGWLVAGLADAGWLDALDPARRAAFAAALAGLYRLAGVDLAREEIAVLLPDGAAWDVADAGLLVWPDGTWGTEAVYDLTPPGPRPPAISGDDPTPPLPPLDPTAARLDLRPLPWRDWVAAWRPDGRLPDAEALLPPRARPARPRAA